MTYLTLIKLGLLIGTELFWLEIYSFAEIIWSYAEVISEIGLNADGISVLGTK